MSKRWPKLWGATTAPIASSDFHPHQAGDISGGQFNDEVVFGDIRSYNWNGGSDLSGGADATATLGYFLDASSGVIQAQVLYAEGGSFTGTIIAGSGTIGGWAIGATSLSDAAGTVGLSSAVTVGDDIRFWAGHATPASAPFRVTEAGVMTALSGELGSLSVTGTLTLSGSGEIVTDTSGIRVMITTADADRIRFYSGYAGETPGWVRARGLPASIEIRSPVSAADGYARYAQLVLRSTAAGTYGEAFLHADTTYVTGNLQVAGTSLKVNGLQAFHPGHFAQADTELDGPTIATYTPTLTATTTNPTLSTDASHTVTGEYAKIGNRVKVWVYIEFGTAGVNAGSGQYIISLPTTASKPTISGTNQPSVGSGRIFDSSGADNYLVDVRLATTTTVRLRYDQQTASGNVGAAIPYTWANSDYIVIHFEYLEA